MSSIKYNHFWLFVYTFKKKSTIVIILSNIYIKSISPQFTKCKKIVSIQNNPVYEIQFLAFKILNLFVLIKYVTKKIKDHSFKVPYMCLIQTNL